MKRRTSLLLTADLSKGKVVQQGKDGATLLQERRDKNPPLLVARKKVGNAAAIFSWV